MSQLSVGWPVQTVRDIVAETLHTIVDPMVYDEAVVLIEEHRAAGRDVVIVSTSGAEVVEPIGEMLGVDHVIATQMVVEEGRYTGEIAFYAFGPNKAAAIRELAAEQGYDLATATATPTPRPTCRCWRRSGSRTSSTPTARCAGSPSSGAGRCCGSPPRSRCAAGWACARARGSWPWCCWSSPPCRCRGGLAGAGASGRLSPDRRASADDTPQVFRRPRTGVQRTDNSMPHGATGTHAAIHPSYRAVAIGTDPGRR